MAAPDNIERYQPNTIADDIQRRLRKSLFSGSYAPGQTISIRRLAEEQKTSVIPARDALRGLVAEGVLEFKDSRTIVVPTLDADRHCDVLFARISLECELANRAYASLGQADLMELQAIDARLDQAIAKNDAQSYVQENHAFHFYIYHRARSQVILRLVESLWLQYAPSMSLVCKRFGASGIVHDYHRMALTALKQKDREAFVAAIQSDIQQGMDFIADANITNQFIS